MAELLKNRYNEAFFKKFIAAFQKVKPDFEHQSFLTHIYDDTWESRELKQRMRHISTVLQAHLSDDFEDNVTVLLNTIPQLLKDGFKADSLEFIFLADFIEIYGLNHYETSIKAIEKMTQFVSCEFAVRPFIIKYEKPMMAQMLSWSNHSHASVRRLASEGCRPRLPWAIALPALKKDANSIISILDNLKTDSSEYVRRSVANNLNDISKDHPLMVIELIKKWKGQSKATDALLKHASRTLLKAGKSEVMQLFGFGSIENIELKDFKIHTPCLKIGESLIFSFKLINRDAVPLKLRLEYGMYYQKANGTLSKKVFKISEKEYKGHSATEIKRLQPFKVISTRRLHAGLHQVSVIVNGTEHEKLDFQLVH